MHILLGALAVLGAIAIWVWRIRMAAEAAREVAGVADDMRAALRRFGMRRRAGQHPSDVVDDPRLAAAGILAALARMDGDITDRQRNAIEVEARAVFRVDAAEAQDIAAYGRWLSSQSANADDAVWRLSRRFQALASNDTYDDLLGMMTRIAAIEGGEPNALQNDAIETVRRRLRER